MERHYTNGTEPDVLPHWECHGPCHQGRLPCPTPHACERPENDNPYRLSTIFLAAVCVIIAAFMAGITYGVLFQ